VQTKASKFLKKKLTLFEVLPKFQVVHAGAYLCTSAARRSRLKIFAELVLRSQELRYSWRPWQSWKTLRGKNYW